MDINRDVEYSIQEVYKLVPTYTLDTIEGREAFVNWIQSWYNRSGWELVMPLYNNYYLFKRNKKNNI